MPMCGALLEDGHSGHFCTETHVTWILVLMVPFRCVAPLWRCLLLARCNLGCVLVRCSGLSEYIYRHPEMCNTGIPALRRFTGLCHSRQRQGLHLNCTCPPPYEPPGRCLCAVFNKVDSQQLHQQLQTSPQTVELRPWDQEKS